MQPNSVIGLHLAMLSSGIRPGITGCVGRGGALAGKAAQVLEVFARHVSLGCLKARCDARRPSHRRSYEAIRLDPNNALAFCDRGNLKRGGGHER